MLAQGAEVLEAIAGASERLIEQTIKLRKLPGVRGVIQAVDCRRLRSGSSLALYVEAKLVDERTLTWWLEVSWCGEWLIESRLLRDHRYGQEIVHRFSDRRATTAGEFADELSRAVDALVSSMAEHDLAQSFLVETAR